MTTIMEDLDLPGEPTLNAPTDCILGVVDPFGRYISAFDSVTGVSIVSPRVIPITSGAWADDLVPSNRLSPEGASYRRILNGPNFRMDDLFDVPDAGGPYTVMERKIDSPAYVGSAALEQHILDTLAHAGGYYDRAVDETTLESSGTGLFRFVPLTVTVEPSTRLQVVDFRGHLAVANPTIAFTGGSLTSNVVTLTGLPGGHGILAGEIVHVDAADNQYDGSYVVLTSLANSITYARTAANDASSGAGVITRNVPSIATIGLFDNAAFNIFGVKDGVSEQCFPNIPAVSGATVGAPTTYPLGRRVKLEWYIEGGTLSAPIEATVGAMIEGTGPLATKTRIVSTVSYKTQLGVRYAA